MVNNEERNAFDEYRSAALLNLGGLVSCDEIVNDTKAIIKINHFRKWLMNLNIQ